MVFTKDEIGAQKQARAIELEEAVAMVEEVDEKHGAHWHSTLLSFFAISLTTGSQQIQVQSFTNDGVQYTLKGSEGSLSTCTCPKFEKTGNICQHIFLGHRILNQQI
jgi:hypothetical protein